MSSSKRAIDRMVKLHRRWVSDTGEEVREYATDRINVGLAEGSARSLRNIGSNLKSLAIYWGTHGDLSLVDGDPLGWQHVHHSCLMYLWVVRLESLSFRILGNSPSLTLFPPLASCALCYAITMDLHDWRRELVSLLSQMSSDPFMVKREYWQERCFEPFVLRLHGLMESDGHYACHDGDSYGVYTDILNYWNKEESLSYAITHMLDYHCKNMNDMTEWDPEFDYPSFDLIPWELLAIIRIRELAGLANPSINHPLAKPMVIQVEKSAQIQSEMLTRVEAFYNEVLFQEL